MLYLGDNPIAGLVKPIAARNVGEIVTSSLPLTDAGLHLLDGSLILGGGIYDGFVDYIAELYNNSSKISNVTKVGSLTDNNGVLSGFSTSNYAQLPNSVSLGNNFEICVKFTTGSDVTTNAQLFRSSKKIACFAVETSSVFGYNIGDGSSWLADNKGSHTVQANTTYYGKLTYNGSVYKAYISTDNENWVEDWSFTSSNIVPNAVIDIGLNATSTIAPWLGSIDLNESYININGQRWWSGANPSWATDETQWQQSVTTYGSCGKFVYDSTNNTVRLPKVSNILQGTTDVTALGDLVEAGLPIHTHTRGTMNITGYIGGGLGAYDGAFYHGWSYSGSAADGGGSVDDVGSFDASRTWTGNTSNPIYTNNIQNSSTVQPQTIKVLYYIVIANSTKTEIQVDIDEITTDLNGKADTDLSNLTNGLANTICITKPTTTSSASSERPAVVIQNYVNGTSWYRVWSDGWCEQGGYFDGGSSSIHTVQLIKAYRDALYTVICIPAGSANNTTDILYKNFGFNLTTTSFQVQDWMSWRWRACGYII